MKKTTIYLPEELKKQVRKLAREEKRSEADFIRDAIATAVDRARRPKPRTPIPGLRFREANVAERVDELMEGFGE